MNTRFPGNNGLEVSAVGLGCMGMSHAYGAPADKSEMKRLIEQAVDLGISFFDTAEVYGPFENEELVGEALAPYHQKWSLQPSSAFPSQRGSQVPSDGQPPCNDQVIC